MPPVALLAVGTAISAGGAIYGMQANNKAAQAQTNQLALRSQQERLQQLRESKIRAGAIVQSGANQAGTSASAVVGGAQSVYGQAESNEQYISAEQGVGNQEIEAKREEAFAQGLVSLGDTVSSAGENYDKFKSVFT